MIVKFTKNSKTGSFIVNSIGYDYNSGDLNFGIFHEDYDTAIIVDKSRCKILDGRIPSGWILEVHENNSFTIEPKEFTEPIDPNTFDYSKIDFIKGQIAFVFFAPYVIGFILIVCAFISLSNFISLDRWPIKVSRGFFKYSNSKAT